MESHPLSRGEGTRRKQRMHAPHSRSPMVGCDSFVPTRYRRVIPRRGFWRSVRFMQTGEVEDPEDGLVWWWKRPKESA